MSSSDDPDTPSTSNSAKRKKPSYDQKYKEVWEKEFNWISKSKRGPNYAWCKSCNSDVNISHGKGEIIKHSQTMKHKKTSTAITGQRSISAMFVSQKKSLDLDVKVKEADIRIAGFLCEHNLPFKLMDHFGALISAVCSDSEIGRKINCGRTKVKSIITNVTGYTERERIIDLMKKNKFSLIADESTDRSCVKTLCLVVRVNVENKKIKDYFLTLIPVQEATGAALYQHIVSFLNNNNINFKENCIGFASDGANNMMGAHNSVVSRFREAIPNIFIMKCICHTFHLCASYACEKLPREVEKLARDIHNYFSNSPKRVGEFKEFQEFTNSDQLKILHPSATRWLSLESVVKRLLNQYNALVLYFTEQSFKNIIEAKTILEYLQKREIKMYLEFLSYALPFFTRLNRIMQSEKPQIHKLYREVKETVKIIMACFIKEEIMLSENFHDFDYKDPQNFMELEKMYFGACINNSTLQESCLHELKLKCLNFYIESIHQILSRFPLNDSIFQKLEFLDPEIVISRKITTISNIFLHFPNLIDNIQELDNEWRALRTINYQDFNINIDTDIIEFWANISDIRLGSGEKKFPTLINLVFNLLSLPHSSANVERIFSQVNLNKTRTRNRLKSETLEGMLLTKSLVDNTGDCYNFTITNDLLNRHKSEILYGQKKNPFDSDSSE